MDHSYDQVIQARHTKKMLAQISAEADLLEEFDYPQSILDIEDEFELQAAKKEFADRVIEQQSEELIRRMMGQRVSRKNWGNIQDLEAKDKMPRVVAETPSRVGKRTRDLMAYTPSPRAKRSRLGNPLSGEPIDPDR